MLEADDNQPEPCNETAEDFDIDGWTIERPEGSIEYVHESGARAFFGEKQIGHVKLYSPSGEIDTIPTCDNRSPTETLEHLLKEYHAAWEYDRQKGKETDGHRIYAVVNPRGPDYPLTICRVGDTDALYQRATLAVVKATWLQNKYGNPTIRIHEMKHREVVQFSKERDALYGGRED